MNTATVYARRARAARDAAQSIAYSTRQFTRDDDVRTARLTDYADLCSDMAVRASATISRPVESAADHALDTRAAWQIVRFDRERRAGLRYRLDGTKIPAADQVPMHLQ